MATGAEDYSGGEVGFEEGMSCLPSHVLNEALFPVDTPNPKRKAKYHYHPKSVAEQVPVPVQSKHQQFPRGSSRQQYRSKGHNNGGISRGSGMQAIFLDGGHRSCGTGVFLPQRIGSNFQPNNKKPACSPVLLPWRVVQALNLNVHAIGLNISGRQDSKDRSVKNNSKTVSNDVSVKRKFVSQNQSSSPELFLPKEWTY